MQWQQQQLMRGGQLFASHLRPPDFSRAWQKNQHIAIQPLIYQAFQGRRHLFIQWSLIVCGSVFDDDFKKFSR